MRIIIAEIWMTTPLILRHTTDHCSNHGLFFLSVIPGLWFPDREELIHMSLDLF